MIMKNYDVTIDEAFTEDNAAAVLIKIYNDYIESNIYLDKNLINVLMDFIDKNTNKTEAGNSANSSVFWSRQDEVVYILIGEDDQSWDISLVADETLLKNIKSGIKAM